MSLDPSKYSTLALTHVQYDSTDPIAKLLSLITLSPIFLLCSYLTIILYRRELTFINALVGQVSCEALNWALKRSFRQPRPTDFLGSGYGMPSSHSQFLGFFASFFMIHFFIHAPSFNRASLISLLRRLEHTFGMIAVFGLTVAVCYSRYHLSYHTPAQILIGLAIGLLYGSIYYYFTETLTRSVSFSLHDVVKNQPQDAKSASRWNPSNDRRSNLKKRSSSTIASNKSSPSATSPSTSTSREKMVPIRQAILDHPIAVAFRIRDSWMVWKDGGVEGEYGIWRKEWESRRKSSSSSLSARNQEVQMIVSKIQGREEAQDKVDLMKLALKEADRCVPLVTAFSVGCVITIDDLTKGIERVPSSPPHSGQIFLSSGYSRELEGNTHAEQCALMKLVSDYDLVSSDKSSTLNSSRKIIGEISLNLYTTMEPCSERLSGQDPCVDRILKFNQQNHLLQLSDLVEIMGITSDSIGKDDSNRFVTLKIKKIFQGVKEPEDFVLCKGTRLLQENGIVVEQVKPPSNFDGEDHSGKEEGEDDWLEPECLRIAKKGHQDQPKEVQGNERKWK